MTLADLIPTQDGDGTWDAALGVNAGHSVTATQDAGELFDIFSTWATDRGLPLYPHQEESLLEIVGDSNVIVGTPTGSGKSLIATAALFTGLATGLYYPLSGWLAAELGWRVAVLVMGGLLAVIALPAHLWAVPGRAAHALRVTRGSGAPVGEALRSAHFWLLLVAFTVVPDLLDAQHDVDAAGRGAS